MEFRPLEITTMQARDLKNVNLMSKMDVYAVVSISGDRRTEQRTAVDKDGGTSPNWKNLSLKFNIDVVAASQQSLLTLDIVLRSDRVLGDRDIGEVHVPVKELLDSFFSEKNKMVSYQIRTPSGRARGTLNLTYKIGEKFTPAPPLPPVAAANKMSGGGEPMMAYPASVGANPPYPPQGAAYPPQYAPYPPQQYAYPPQAGHSHAPPPVAGYGYAPQGYGYAPPQGYGYAPPVQQPKRKNNSKLGLGLGAGLLGGLLVGEMVSDVGEMAAYDAGYDDGFGGGDFDF